MAKNKKMWVGRSVFLALSCVWLIAVVIGFSTFGWVSRFEDLTPAEFVVQISSLSFPVVLLFLLGSYIDRKKMVDFETKAIRSYLEELVYPSELGAQHVTNLNADLKQQIKQFRGCFDDVFKKTDEVRESLTNWIADLNTLVSHMGEQTNSMSTYVQELADANRKAKEQSADAGQNLAAQADILMRVADEAHAQLSDTAKGLQTQAEEITQNVHAVMQAEKSIEQALDKSASWVGTLSDNANQIEKSLKSTDKLKDFLIDTDNVLLKFKEIGTTLDLRLKALKKTKPSEVEVVAMPVENPVAMKFTEKMQQILDQLQGLSVEMISVFEIKNEEALWEQYYAGDKAIFMRHIKSLLSQPKSQRNIRNAMENKAFKENAEEYMKDFEELTRGLENSPWLGVLVGSDPGRLYMVLATLFKGEKDANKIG